MDNSIIEPRKKESRTNSSSLGQSLGQSEAAATAASRGCSRRQLVACRVKEESKERAVPQCLGVTASCTWCTLPYTGDCAACESTVKWPWSALKSNRHLSHTS